MNRRVIACFLSALILSTNVYPAPVAEGDEPATCDNILGNSQWKGKRVAFLGDSITDKRRIGTTKCYWEYLSEWMQFTPYIYGINGNRMDGVLKQAQKLLAEQGDSIDAIFIFAGTNDYNGGVPLGEWYTVSERETLVKGGATERRMYREPVMNDSTFRGRINMVLDFLKTNYPEKQVIMLTPIHRAKARFSGENIQPEELFPNKLGLYVEEYVNAVKEAANVWAVPVIDLNSISGLYPLNDAHARYFHDSETDRLHPNAKGHERMAKAIAYQLLALPASF